MIMRKRRITTALLFLLLFATTMLFVPLENPVWASAVHKDPSTFKKNYDLKPEQKKAVIVESEDVVNTIIKPNMSDLEKYYTLAKWVNKRAIYDWNFWSGGYDFDYYNHQWDSYGVLYDKSICVSIAIFYSHMCHAAGLPCKFVRVTPEKLDHTISYIPNINDHDYYVDVTENIFLMSKLTNPYGPMDEAFSGVTSDLSDGSFDYKYPTRDWMASEIKEYYNVPFSDWFREYAQHVDTKKTFRNKYREKGSGTYGVNYASYKDYSSNFTDKTDIWFLDDYYSFDSSKDETRDLADIKEKILGKTFDDRLMIVSGVKKNYDLDTNDPQFENTLKQQVENDCKVEFFPSSDDKGQILPKADKLTENDYDVTSVIYNDATHTATITFTGKGDYNGTHDIQVPINSAVVTDDPVPAKGLVYNSKPLKLIEPGTAENGSMQYALGTETKPTGKFTEAIPTATEPGPYRVWFKAVASDKNHFDSQPMLMERPATIKKISMGDADITLSPKDFTYNGKVQKPAITKINGISVKAGRDYTLEWDNTDSYKDAGTYIVYIEGKGNYFTSDTGVAFEIKKANNPIKSKGKTVKVKRNSLKKKAKTIQRAKAINVSKAKGKLSFKLVSAKKGKKSYKKKFKINSKTGNVTIAKRLKKGTFKVTVKVKANGNSNYNASSWKKVTFKVRVK